MDIEEIKLAKQNYIFTTTHELDNENKALKHYVEYLESLLKYSIPKQKIQDLMNEVLIEYSKLDKEIEEGYKKPHDMQQCYEHKEKVGMIQMLSWFRDNLQELLENKEGE